ncbi:MAG: UDP-N-acetylmuramoyl-L-alanyl-D-glutamate--2,6-diaminopimelate ligase [Bacillota bacterium]
MKLTQLLQAIENECEVSRVPGLDLAGLEIEDLSYHSGRVGPGDLFLCIPGEVTDGHLHAQEAVSAGARALLVERVVNVEPPVPQMVVSDARRTAADLADRFFDHPTGRMVLVGVTGTSGKTTTAHLIRHLLEADGGSVGLVGTVGNIAGGNWMETTLTTPEATDLQRLFRQMLISGDRAAVMEVSSHSLMLHRVHRCAFNVGVFTNIAPEHLDFHGDMDSYLAAKARLFTMLTDEGLDRGGPRAVINADDARSAEIESRSVAEVLTYGLRGGEVTARDVQMTQEETTFLLEMPAGRRRVRLRLPGRFNVYNALAAAAAAHSLDVATGVIADALSGATPVPGRYEVVSGPGDDITVIVDFAHTPDELSNLLEAVTSVSAGRVITVFGAGGDRDRTKRPVMGSVVEDLADYMIVTSDNPRSEDPRAITCDILRGIEDNASCEVIVDRREAVLRAVEMAGPADTVVVAGKGHETMQILADCAVHFDDRLEARKALRLRRQRREGG